MNKPMAAKGLISYRCKGSYCWIMIGAKNHDDAMNEAFRSSRYVKPENLQIWDETKYVSVYDTL
ncbi:hypothetical protein UFOVP35_66 [uncultured Caudovirales phage]|uniref:Uncharacterized protein n=1 Tax=uncultured Caudovirales phage TaxID=2100421 RepID=A0A6J7WSJ2_9CAUD|nr:hypothetical protein UFOVP35_66 [uncultured Caudovirales phage]CAB4124832.1 hypothetical protein UFOVP52_57 [uncultured Caudovirales phage]CAB5219798.1 hypothetical protein UFOVP234_5 [uncultured Caudovirales phage]